MLGLAGVRGLGWLVDRGVAWGGGRADDDETCSVGGATVFIGLENWGRTVENRGGKTGARICPRDTMT